jgi:chloramphenicol 3-O phosphotransferase
VRRATSRPGERAERPSLTVALPSGSSNRPGSLIWLMGGPSVGKSSVARAIQAAGGAADPWILAGDHHLLGVIAAHRLVRRGDRIDDGWEGWTVPYTDGRVVGPPHTGPRALRIVDGMYRAAVAMVAAGNNVVLEDVVWEPEVAAVARGALEGSDPFTVRLSCPTSVALAREQARTDRLVGSVAAFAQQAEPIVNVAVELDTSRSDPAAIAQQILTVLAARAGGEASPTPLR